MKRTGAPSPFPKRQKVAVKTFKPKARTYARPYPGKESGFFDLALTTLALNTTGTIVLANTIVQGVATNQRVGKKIQLSSLQIRGNAQADNTTLLALGAIMLVYDRRPTGALPAITDILVTADANSFTNDANTGRFKILKRWQFSLVGNNATAGQATDSSQYSIDDYLPIKNKQTVYKAAGTGAIADIEEGAIYLVGVGNQVAGTADGNANIAIRTRFYDV